MSIKGAFRKVGFLHLEVVNGIELYKKSCRSITKGEVVKDIDLLVMERAEPWNKVSNKTVEQSL